MMEFDLGPGPLIGTLLDKLREEQAAGTITGRSQALCWVEDELSHQEFLER
jgi:arginine repressor